MAADWRAEFIYVVDLQIIKGIDLLAADRGNKSDPFVKILCGNRQFKTDVIDGTLNPEWNAVTQFSFMTEPKDIYFEAIDKDTFGSNDPLGDYRFSLKGFFEKGHKGFNDKFKLQNVSTGELQVVIKCTRFAPFHDIADAANLKQELDGSIVKRKNVLNEEEVRLRREGLELANEVQGLRKQCEELDTQRTDAQSQLDILQKKAIEDDNARRAIRNELNQQRKELKELDVEYRNIGKSNGIAGAVESVVETTNESNPENVQKPQNPQNGIVDVDTGVSGDYVQRIEDFMALLKEDLDDRDFAEDVKLDGDICEALLASYKEARRLKIEKQDLLATLNDESKVPEDDEKRESSDQMNRDFQEASAQAAEHLQLLRTWKADVENELDEQRRRDVQKVELNGDKEFFGEMFMKICNLIFNVRVVGATLKVFKEEIKEITKKKSDKLVFDDLFGDGGPWTILYDNELDTIRQELNPYLMAQPLKDLYKRTQSFIESYQQGHYQMFAREFAKALSELTLAKQKNCVVNDAMGAFVLLLGHKHFLEDLFAKCINEYEDERKRAHEVPISINEEDVQSGNTNEQQAQPEQNTIFDMDDQAFEKTVALIVIQLQVLDEFIGLDLLLPEQEMKIMEAKDEVLKECGQMHMGKGSRKMVEEFFSSFFKFKSSGFCSCGEGSFFGNLFGKMCK